MTLEGIDVSYAQSHTPSLVGKSFAFAKATEGTAVDPMYAQHMANFRTAGIVAGAYHFGLSGHYASINDQVAKFLAVAGSADLLALDKEIARDSHGNALPYQMTTTEAQAFISAVRAKGRKCGLYASRSGYPIAVNCDFRWIADYTGTVPNIAWQFWQYTNKGTAYGLDLDKFNGDQAALDALAGKDTPMSSTFAITDATPRLLAVAAGVQYYDLAGNAKVKQSTAASSVYSPAQTSGTYVVEVSTSGVLQLLQVHKTDVTNVRLANAAAQTVTITGSGITVKGP